MRPPSASAGGDGASRSESVNPLNMMPALSQQPTADQRVVLPVERTVSSIPRPAQSPLTDPAARAAHDAPAYSGQQTTSFWEYPSPQQFYNALRRKGWETPEDKIEVMVAIHNFLNEACWDEIQRWERKYHCDCKEPIQLVKFQGRPHQLTPKARLLRWFGGATPFDRHDWTIDRCGKQVRYVMDYYSNDDDDDDDAMPQRAPPRFNVDVRPALDSPGAAFDRLREGLSDAWAWAFSQ
ncbi:hypothetical protein CXG81DRAFT_15326 [Caulochytrium protostelioides]|uniref:Holocytochrome c-type synthase n=1 Tax=Caulochytrium protostelioides TaxID=1555241 RepID=A0A4P9WZF8_9FUNG|nr:hypothetical protein CXG81DRAFT_15326 [Caulochytrium protostelioides]|eukprot:RKO98894.1 hypothetical protein CXG81DRAFT_15326 [Caulochytrium protostelioides]